MAVLCRHKFLYDMERNEISCQRCGATYNVLEFDINGIRDAPAFADENQLGTDLNSELRRWKGVGFSDGDGNADQVKDARGAPITPDWMLAPDKRHSVKAIYDGKNHKTWEELQIQKFWIENCDRMDLQTLRRRIALFDSMIRNYRKEYRQRVRESGRELAR